jgi:hypothetical protein
MIWTAVLIGAVPMAVTVYFAQNLLKNQRPVVYYGGLIGAGLLAYDFSEGDYSIWDYGEPACQICQEHTDEPHAVDSHCEVCNMGLCEACYKSSDHNCLKIDNFGEINCEDCGGAIKVLYQVGSDGPEQGWCDC